MPDDKDKPAAKPAASKSTDVEEVGVAERLTDTDAHPGQTRSEG